MTDWGAVHHAASLVVWAPLGDLHRPVAPRRRADGRATQDIDDWLAVIASGRCVGITPESTVTQYRRQGIAFRPLRNADPVPV